MKEKKKINITIPSIIIIIVIIVGGILVFYNRNPKDVTREQAKNIAKKVMTIDNISCEIVVTLNNRDDNKSIVDYKMKDGKFISNNGNYTTYEDEETKIQIDNNEKTAYKYSDFKSEITNFKELLYTAEKLLESDEYDYNFLRYETMNGTKTIVFNSSNSNTTFDVWIDKSTGMIVKMECHYHENGEENIDTTMYYRYQLNNVKDEDVKMPDLNGYSITEL